MGSTLHIALLRAINVGGRNLVAMTDLRQLFTDLGFRGARTLLQSGNVMFESSQKADAQLERQLEKEIAERLGVAADFIVRSANEWKHIVAGNPFPKQAKEDPGHLLVSFLKSAPSLEDVRSLESAIKGPEIIRGDGKQLYIVYPDGVGRSKLTATLIERKLETRGTARNWNTVLKLAAMCE
jgi:uncharacterized protein (DUF1697 family)